MKVWQILAVVAAGLLYGLVAPGRFTYALGHATLYVFLPALLFEAAWNLNYRAMRRHWAAIAMLSGPGVLLTAAIIAAALAAVRIPIGPALLTGAILSATDPIAVVACFRHLRVRRSLTIVVECEALFNDAVAVALYGAVLVALASGAVNPVAVAFVALGTLGGVVGGTLLGIAVAWAAARALRGSRNAGIAIAVTVACAYGAYFAADYARISGIFATIVCGVAIRHFERSWQSLRIAEDVENFWGAGALLANAIVFFMLGAGLQIGRIANEAVFTVVCLAGVAVSRIAVSEVLRFWPYPREWLGVVRVAGMRGALSLALALALPPDLPYRETIIDATFAVVLATFVVAGITIGPAARRAAECGRDAG